MCRPKYIIEYTNRESSRLSAETVQTPPSVWPRDKLAILLHSVHDDRDLPSAAPSRGEYQTVKVATSSGRKGFTLPEYLDRPSAAPPRVEGLKGLKSSLRALARVLGAINQQGVEVVGKALERALETGNSTPMGLIPLPVREYPYGKV